ncbi:MAG: hypothetical protein ACO1OB_32545 [Archangium sp.]
MKLRLMAMVSAVFFAACGGSQSPNDGGATGCTARPFGVYTGTQCDGGALGTFTFTSDGGVSWEMVGPYECTTDAVDCALVMTCPYDAMSSYVFDLQSTIDAKRLSGSMAYQGRTSCVQLAK